MKGQILVDCKICIVQLNFVWRNTGYKKTNYWWKSLLTRSREQSERKDIETKQRKRTNDHMLFAWSSNRNFSVWINKQAVNTTQWQLPSQRKTFFDKAFKWLHFVLRFVKIGLGLDETFPPPPELDTKWFDEVFFEILELQRNFTGSSQFFMNLYLYIRNEQDSVRVVTSLQNTRSSRSFMK